MPIVNVNEDLSGKLDKVTTGGGFRAYTVLSNGTNNMTTVTNNATANTIVSRDGNGRFKAATPSVGADVATKEYVDTAVSGAGGGSKWTAMTQYDIMGRIEYGSNVGDELIGNYITFSGASFTSIDGFHFIWTGTAWVGSALISLGGNSRGIATKMRMSYDETTGDSYLQMTYLTGTTESMTSDYFFGISATAMSEVYYCEGGGVS